MSEIPKWKDRLDQLIKENENEVTVSVDFLRGISVTLEAYSDAHKAQELFASDLIKQLEEAEK